jgi:hypothetical protein
VNRALLERPVVGRLTVPFMVDATRTPIDFKALDAAHVDLCASDGRCGICGGKIRRGPIAFIGPSDGRSCFGDPWMHPDCARLAMEQCPFLAGRRDWRDEEARSTPLLRPYSESMGIVLAHNWRSHRDALGGWHFEALGKLTPEADDE